MKFPKVKILPTYVNFIHYQGWLSIDKINVWMATPMGSGAFVRKYELVLPLIIEYYIVYSIINGTTNYCRVAEYIGSASVTRRQFFSDNTNRLATVGYVCGVCPSVRARRNRFYRRKIK